MWPNLQFPADLVTFTEKVLHGKFHFYALSLNTCLCQGLFFNKVAGLRLAALSKQRLWHRCFPVNFTKFLRTPFLQNTHLRQLLLKMSNIIRGTTFNFSRSQNKDFADIIWTMDCPISSDTEETKIIFVSSDFWQNMCYSY